MKNALLLSLALLTLGPIALRGQEDPAIQLMPEQPLFEVVLVDGTVLIGSIQEQSETTLVLVTLAGVTFELQRADIRSVAAASGSVVNSQFWRADPSSTRLFFTTTGRSLSRGEGYVGVYLLVLPFAAVGVTDRLTVAGGAPILFGEVQPAYLAPKLQVFRNATTQIALGTLMLIGDDLNVGVAYGVGTFGSPDVAVTGGIGFGYAGADFSKNAVGMLGIERRVSGSIKLISENYFLPIDGGSLIVSAGIRILGKSLTGDVGLAGLIVGQDEPLCCLPLLNLSYAVGRLP
jgi:hypothetical protein